MNFIASRRDVLKGGGALVVSFSLAPVGDALAQGPAKPVTLTEVDSFLAIDSSGQVWSTPARSISAPASPRRCGRSWPRSSTCRFSKIALLQGDTS